MDNDMDNEVKDEEIGEIYEANFKSEILDIDFNIENYDKNKNITKPILNKYERVTVMIMRCEQINSGSVPYIKDYEKYNTIEEIVEEELKQKKIPFIIKRSIINSIDYWKLHEMDLII
jgi:DNA-directed RNA polymerase subunit K/omega